MEITEYKKAAKKKQKKLRAKNERLENINGCLIKNRIWWTKEIKNIEKLPNRLNNTEMKDPQIKTHIFYQDFYPLPMLIKTNFERSEHWLIKNLYVSDSWIVKSSKYSWAAFLFV